MYVCTVHVLYLQVNSIIYDSFYTEVSIYVLYVVCWLILEEHVIKLTAMTFIIANVCMHVLYCMNSGTYECACRYHKGHVPCLIVTAPETTVQIVQTIEQVKDVQRIKRYCTIPR